MQTTQTFNESATSREAAVTTLAVVGFLALIAAGMWLAVYSARFVPGALSRIDSAAVELSSLFSPAPTSLAIVPPTASTTISFGDGTSTPATSTPVTKPITTTEPGTPSNGTYPVGTGTGSATYSGLPDLNVTITAVGYLTTNSTSSFVAASTVPAGYRPAVQFTIKNIGTNVAGSWRFSANIPTSVGYVFDSLTQQPLNPGDSVAYTLGFDNATIGSNESITITANYDNAIAESNTTNNTASTIVNVQ